MTKKTFDPKKPVQTRDGRKVRILCVDAKNDKYPIVALVTSPEGKEGVCLFAEDGKYLYKHPDKHWSDLLNIVEKKSIYRSFKNPNEISYADFYNLVDAIHHTLNIGYDATLRFDYEDDRLVNISFVSMEGED